MLPIRTCSFLVSGAALLFALSEPRLAAQAETPETQAPGGASRALPAPAAGSERLVVLFDTRSFDLDDLAAAARARVDVATWAGLVDGLSAQAAADQAAFATFVDDLGGRVAAHWWLINGCAIDVPERAGVRAAVAGFDGVAAVHEDVERRAAGVALPIRTATNANNHRVDALQAQGIRGAGITVAVVDSGFDSDMNGVGRPHAVFYPGGNPLNTSGGGIGGSRLLANVQVGRQPADNSNDHGTAVAAVAVGARWNASSVADDGHAPEASMVGYAIGDDPSGLTALATMVQALQLVVTDRTTYGTSVVNMSYDGTADPLFPEEQALDAAAVAGDLLITVSAGARAPNGIYRFAHGATNVLAVGAANADVHSVAAISGVGGSGVFANRTYPSLVGNGVNISTALTDNEGGRVIKTGTSYGAPQVAGAAALFRSQNPSASALETRAAILATTEEIGRVSAVEARGHGYLRDDRLIDLAQGNAGLLVSNTVGAAQPRFVATLNVTRGESYAVALCFNRRSFANATWADLDLTVRQLGEELGASAQLDDTNERVVFRARATGTVDLEVVARRFELGSADQPFALAASPAPDALVPGRIDVYGASCAGSRTGANVRTVEPLAAMNAFGATSTSQPLGGAPHRFQQLFAAQPIQASFNVRGIAFRPDDVVLPTGRREWVELEIDLGQSAVAPAGMSATFAQNYSAGRPVNVFSRKRISLPPIAAPAASPTDWDIPIPFDRAVSKNYDYAFGLTLDIRTYASSGGAGGFAYPVDAINQLGTVSSVFAANPNATTGTVQAGLGAVVALLDDAGTPYVPVLAGTGTPELGQSYGLDLSGAPPSAPLTVFVGASNTTWLGQGLPRDLGVLGASGCWLLASPDISAGLLANPGGTANVSIPVASNPSLLGLELFHQALVIDAGANVLGATLTNGVAVSVGG